MRMQRRVAAGRYAWHRWEAPNQEETLGILQIWRNSKMGDVTRNIKASLGEIPRTRTARDWLPDGMNIQEHEETE